MKKPIQLLLAFLFAFSINAQEPVIKFYRNDGGNKTYKLSDIKNIGVMKSDSSFIMKIFYQKTKTSSYLTASLDSLNFDGSYSNLLVHTTGNTNQYKLSEIDSIVLYPVASFKPVIICEHVFMSKNLDVEQYSNGDAIPNIWNRFAWDSLNKAQTGAWCYYNNDPEMGKIYGRLYNWYAVNDPRGLCPKGWHVSSDAEWTAMVECLGGASVAGSKLKEADTTHWDPPNKGATNETCFTALPGGWRGFSGAFYNKHYGLWWTSTESTAKEAWYKEMSFDNPGVATRDEDKRAGYSVRCVRNK